MRVVNTLELQLISKDVEQGLTSAAASKQSGNDINKLDVVVKVPVQVYELPVIVENEQ